MSIHTRSATEDDVFVMENILRDAFGESYAHFMPEQYIREWYDSNEAQKIVRMGVEDAGIAEIMGRVVGFVTCEDSSIEQLWVDPEYQGQGVGSALVDWVEERHRRRGFVTISMYCVEYNANCLMFLKKHRFRRVSQFLDSSIPGGPIQIYNMLKMVRKLKR